MGRNEEYFFIDRRKITIDEITRQSSQLSWGRHTSMKEKRYSLIQAIASKKAAELRRDDFECDLWREIIRLITHAMQAQMAEPDPEIENNF